MPLGINDIKLDGFQELILQNLHSNSGKGLRNVSETFCNRDKIDLVDLNEIADPAIETESDSPGEILFIKLGPSNKRKFKYSHLY